MVSVSRQGPGCCSTGITSEDLRQPSSAPLSGSGEVEEERGVVEEVLEVEECGEVSEEQAA